VQGQQGSFILSIIFPEQVKDPALAFAGLHIKQICSTSAKQCAAVH
jgi:hypothetical protein